MKMLLIPKTTSQNTDNLLKTRAWVTGELAKTRREFEFQVRFSENEHHLLWNIPRKGRKETRAGVNLAHNLTHA